MLRDWRTEYEEELTKLTPLESKAFNEYCYEQQKKKQALRTHIEDPDRDQKAVEGQKILRFLLQDRQLPPPVKITTPELFEQVESIRRSESLVQEATIQLMYFHCFQRLEQFKKDQNNKN